LPLGQRIVPVDISPGHFGFDVYDVVMQHFSSQHFSLDGEHIRAHPVPFRYVWPAELDLMTRIAGMRLRERWADWDRSPFIATSTKQCPSGKHVTRRAQRVLTMDLHAGQIQGFFHVPVDSLYAFSGRLEPWATRQPSILGRNPLCTRRP
jgi:hypothetical protein